MLRTLDGLRASEGGRARKNELSSTDLSLLPHLRASEAPILLFLPEHSNRGTSEVSKLTKVYQSARSRIWCHAFERLPDPLHFLSLELTLFPFPLKPVLPGKVRQVYSVRSIRTVHIAHRRRNDPGLSLLSGTTLPFFPLPLLSSPPIAAPQSYRSPCLDLENTPRRRLRTRVLVTSVAKP